MSLAGPDAPSLAGAVRVRVPATSANLGPGFDTLGLALAWYDEVTARATDEAGARVQITGEGADNLPTDERHLVVRTMHTTWAALGVPAPAGLALECVNRIPQARGLGSSSAAIVAGILLARALVPSTGSGLDVLGLAAEIEGHPDNVAPCLLGGFTIAWADAGGTHAVRLPVSPAVTAVVYVPSERGLTRQARAVLPERVPHADAAVNAGRAALLVHALSVDPTHLFAATEDRLHQGYRAASMPATADLVQRLRAQGVPAVVSGAGPSVLALLGADHSGGWSGQPVEGWRVEQVAMDTTGPMVVKATGTVEHAGYDYVAAGRAC